MAAVTYTIVNTGNQSVTVNTFTFVNPVGVGHTADLSNLGLSSSVTGVNVTLPTPYTLAALGTVTFTVDYTNYGITVGAVLSGNIYVNGSEGTSAAINTTITVGSPYQILISPNSASWTGPAIPGASIYKDPIFKSWTVPGTYTFELPNNYTKLTVWAVGGGGGGGAASRGYVSGTSGAGGGGGGGTSQVIWTRLKGGNTVVVVVGAGGAGGTLLNVLTSSDNRDGKPGGDSTVGYSTNTTIGPGGTGGGSGGGGYNGAGGAGGAASGAGYSGGAGGDGAPNTSNLNNSAGTSGTASTTLNLLGYSPNISVGGGGGGGGEPGGSGGGTAGAGASRNTSRFDNIANNGFNGAGPGDGGGGANCFRNSRGGVESGNGGYGRDGAVYILAE